MEQSSNFQELYLKWFSKISWKLPSDSFKPSWCIQRFLGHNLYFNIYEPQVRTTPLTIYFLVKPENLKNSNVGCRRHLHHQTTKKESTPLWRGVIEEDWKGGQTKFQSLSYAIIFTKKYDADKKSEVVKWGYSKGFALTLYIFTVYPTGPRFFACLFIASLINTFTCNCKGRFIFDHLCITKECTEINTQFTLL